MDGQIRKGSSHSGPTVSGNGPWPPPGQQRPRRERALPSGGMDEIPGGGGWAAWRWGAACTLCLVLAGVLLAGSPAATPVSAQLERLTSAQAEGEETLGGLRYVGNWISDTATAVFAPSPVEFCAAAPCVGVRVQDNDLADRASLSLYTLEDPAVWAVADGKVFYVGENADWGRYVRIQHNGGFASIYAGVAPSVKVGDYLEAGEILGTAEDGKTLGFALWKDGAPVPEEDYVQPVS